MKIDRFFKKPNLASMASAINYLSFVGSAPQGIISIIDIELFRTNKLGKVDKYRATPEES